MFHVNMFTVTGTSDGVNMVLINGALAAMAPMAVIVWGVLEARGASHCARQALDRVRGLEWVRQVAGTHGR